MEYYKQRFGSDKVESMIPQMIKVGESEGIHFSYGGYLGITMDSHRFIYKAREVGGSALQDKMVEALFAAYFEKEQSLGDPQVLQECADKAGMAKEVTKALLEDPTMGKTEVEEEENSFRTRWNCRGVPLFVIDGKYSLSGAQPPEAFEEVFSALMQDKNAYVFYMETGGGVTS